MNTYIVDDEVFKRLSGELGEANAYCYYDYSYYAQNVCNSGICFRDSNCVSDCCDGSRCSAYWCGANGSLAWLWWLIAFMFLFICIASIIAQAKRRRRQMELMNNLAHHHDQTHGQVDVVYYNNTAVPPTSYQAQYG